MKKEELAVNGVTAASKMDKAFLDEARKQEELATALSIGNEVDYEAAGIMTKKIKTAQKEIDAHYEPMRLSTYNAYKVVIDTKKAIMDPLKNAEAILKKKMSGYIMEQERKRREEEERLRRIAIEEAEKKKAEAVWAEMTGDAQGAEYASAEAEVMVKAAETVSVARVDTKMSGVSQSKSWVIKEIDLSKLPVEFNGVLIRPADLKAIMGIIKSSNGQVAIPGVEFEETVNIAVRAS